MCIFKNLVLFVYESILEVMSMKTNAFFSFPNKTRIMKDKDKVTPWLLQLSTSLLRFSFSVDNS